MRRFRPEVDRLLVEIPAGGSPGAVLEAIERRGGRVVSLEIAQEGDRRSIAVDVELRGIDAPLVVADVGEIDGVLEVRWTDVAPLCSRNAHKARELERLMPGWSIAPLDAESWPEETGTTYYENALLEGGVRLRARRAGWTIGEDSGIEVRLRSAAGPASTRRATRPRGCRRSGSCSASSRASRTGARATCPSSSRSRPTARVLRGTGTSTA